MHPEIRSNSCKHNLLEFSCRNLSYRIVLRNFDKPTGKILFLVLLYQLFFTGVQCAIEGIPLIKNYPRKTYQAGNQNWAVVQDDEGVMYFGNNNGVLIYNGVNWQLTPVPNLSIVRSLKNYGNGKILAGAFDEFGHIMRDSLGNYRYISWKNKVPVQERRFGDIWRIHIVSNLICFQSRSHLLVFDIHGEYITALHPENEFNFSFEVGDSLILQDKGHGLKILESMKLGIIRNSEKINEFEIWDIMALPEHEWLLFTQQHGVYLWDFVALKPWETDISEFLSKNSFYCMATQPNDNLYIGTIQQGLAVINREGYIKQKIDKSNGLQNNTILSITFDHENNLWLGLDNGIDYLETNSNVSYLRQPGGFGSGYCAENVDNMLYLGTNQGVFMYRYGDLGNFEPVTHLNGQAWSFYTDGYNVLCAHHSGAYSIRKGNVTRIGDIQGVWMFLSAPWDRNKLLFGSYGGIGLIEKSGNRFIFRKMLDGFGESSRVMFFDVNENLWISHGYKGIYRIRISRNDFNIEDIKLYGPGQGLPSELNNELYQVRGELIASTRNGIYQYDEIRDTFYSSSKWNRFLESNDIVTKIIEGREHTVWIFQNGILGKLDILNDSLFQYNRQIAPILNDNFLPAFESITFLDDKKILVGIEDGFSILDLESKKPISDKVPFQFVKFEMFNTHRFQTDYNTIPFDPGTKKIIIPSKIPYKYNSLRIQYAIPAFCSSHQIKIRYNLNESSWEGTPEKPEIILTNLNEGRYKLSISIENRSLNIKEYRDVQFIIDAPWFRRWYTYTGFLLLIISLAFYFFYLINKRVQWQKRKALLEQKRQMIQREIRLKEKSQMAEQELIRITNEKLQAELIYKSKELANSTMNIIHKNQMLTDMKARLVELAEAGSGFEREEMRRLIRKIDRELEDKQSWNVFETHFDRVHENFFQRLREKHGNLSPKDLRMCAFLRMNLSSKEIAPLQNISIRSVEISRYRLRKKLELPHDKNLTDYIMSI